MDPFLSQLKSLCARYPTRAKWVFVQSHRNGRTIGDRLVLEGANWANLRMVTPTDVAVRMGAPFLVERGIDPSEEGLGPALAMRLLLDLPEEDGYFRPLAEQPQMAVALWSTLRELRMAGVRSTDLRPDAFVSAQKHAELSALVGAYETFLSTNARGDLATVFEEATRHPAWCPVQPDDCWIEQPDVVWSPAERRLIDTTPGERIVPAALELPGLVAPRRLAAARVNRQAPDPAATLAFLTLPERPVFRPAETGRPEGRPLQRSPERPVFRPAEAGRPEGRPLHFGSESVSLFQAGGTEAEIEEAFRRILASGRSLDDVEIVAASPQYPALIWEKAMRYDWPVTLGQGIPVGATRPGRALTALTEWIEDDFAAGRLRRLLQSGDVEMTDEVSIKPGKAARLLVKAQAAWGRNTYRLSLARLAKSSRARADRDDLPADEREYLEKRAKETDELAGWIDALIVSVPTPGPDGLISLQDIAKAAHTFVSRFAASHSALDAFASASLTAAIAELAALGDFRCPLDQALRFLRERVESLRVGADRPRPGHLYVSSLSTAGFAGRSVVFVVGLEEGRVFPAPFEDPILLDAERRAVSPELARSGDRTGEAVYLALGRLAAMSSVPGVSISLSYSCKDLREYRDTYASWIMLQAYRVISGKPGAVYHDLHKHLGTPKSCVPEPESLVLGESRWWLRGAAAAGDAAQPDVLRAYPSLERGRTALAARESAQFTEFDGYVPAAGAVLDPCRAGAVVSSTQLEGAASCPFKYFLERGLGVYAIEAGERDKDVWIDHMLRGTILHDLYANFLRRCRGENRRVTLPGDHNWLQELGREALAALAVEMPPPSEEVRDRESQLLLDDLALFVEAEAALPSSRESVGFEVAFGRVGATDNEPLAHPDPIVIDLGGNLKLRIAGRIDRVDKVGPAAYEIIDYKTGNYFAPGWKGTFAGGTRMQHALYGLAAVEMLKRIDTRAKVKAFEYYFSSARGHGERKSIATLPLAIVAGVLNDLRAVIVAGLYVHSSGEKSCKFCDYAHACGGDATKSAAALKLADGSLAPYIRLVAHE